MNTKTRFFDTAAIGAPPLGDAGQLYGQRAINRRRGSIVVALLATEMLATFALGRALRSYSAERPRPQGFQRVASGGGAEVFAAPTKGEAPQAREARQVREAGSIPVPPPAAPSATVPRTFTPARGLQARWTVQALLSRVNQNRNPEAVPEYNAAINQAFLSGWLDALSHTSSNVLEGVTDAFRERICRGTLNAEEAIIVGTVFQMAPDVSSPEAFECFFSRFSADSVALRTMVVAWRNTEMDPVPALERLKATASDPETRSLFEPSDPAREAELREAELSEAEPREAEPREAEPREANLQDEQRPDRDIPSQQPVTHPNQENGT